MTSTEPLASARPPVRLRPEAAGSPAVPPPRWLGAVWLLALAATAAMVVTLDAASSAAGVVVGATFLLLGAAVVRVTVREDARYAVHLFTGAFLARFVFAVVVICAMKLAGTTELEGGTDYLLIESGSWALAENWRAGNFIFGVIDQDPGYFYMVAGIYALVGRYVIAPTLLNAFFGAFMAVLVFLLGRELFGRRVGVVAGTLAAFLPTLLFWSSMLYKDTILACAVAWGCYLAVRLARERNYTNAVWLAVSFLPLFMIRPQTGVTLGAALIILVLWSSGVRPGRLLTAGGAVGVLLAILLALESLGLGGKTSTFGRFINPFSEVFATREMWADKVGRNATGFTRFLYGRNLLAAPHLLVVATGLPFILPIPGTFRLGMNFSTFLLPGQLVWVATLPALAYGAWMTLREWRPAQVTLLGFAAVSAVGVALAGYFSNPRYLVQIVPLLLLFTAVGILELRRSWVLYGMLLSLGASLLMAYALVLT